MKNIFIYNKSVGIIFYFLVAFLHLQCYDNFRLVVNYTIHDKIKDVISTMGD